MSRRPPLSNLLRTATAIAALPLLAACAGGGAADAAGAAGGAMAAVSEEMVADYLGVAFGNRYGEPPGGLHKWPGERLVVRPTGEPSYEDRVHLRRLVRQLDAALGHLDLELAEWQERPADFEIRFLPSGGAVDPASPLGRFDRRASGDGRLESALLIVPPADAAPAYVRFNLLAEGLAAGLGLAGTSDREAASAFYGPPNWYEEGWTRRDLALFALHDRTDLTPGLSRHQIAARLRHAAAPGDRQGDDA